ncbi:hypothetical protein ACFZCY_34060 [Streptomyces sp. NPDC007983]|uniref:hypothetical protein n=1 Tax=Streptomyces sp. NPDC007983 TaxID=3364800 RepID=UPI0036ED7DFD
MQSDRAVEARTYGEQGPVSRRWFLGVSGAALLTVGCKDTGGESESGGQSENGENTSEHRAVVPSGALGANFNEDPSTMDFSMLEGLSAGWLRGFVPMPEIDETAPAEQEAIKTLLAAHDKGYGTILSLKFPYNHRPMPSVDSADMDAELARVDKVLDAAMGKADILAIANEPFIESLEKDHHGTLNAFYEKVARHVIAYREKRFGEHCRTRLYMGSLNHLDRPDWRTQATERWLTFARETPEIEGVDIHPHVAAIEDSQKYLDYILPKLRRDQKFLVTEFSLVLLWKEHMRDTIPAEFARRYELPADTKVWQVIRQATEHPFPQRKWQDFLSMSPWFETHKHYLRNQIQKFRDTGQLAVATYGVAQAPAMVKDFGPDKQPWLLNSLYSNLTVQEGEGGKPPRSYSFFDDFRALQRAEDRRPVRTAETTT